jgi:hypothetical protein
MPRYFKAHSMEIFENVNQTNISYWSMDGLIPWVGLLNVRQSTVQNLRPRKICFLKYALKDSFRIFEIIIGNETVRCRVVWTA